MEEAAPKGSHIVVMDDNIQSLVVEIPEDSVVAERKAAGVVNCCTQPLTHEASCFNPLAGTGLSTMDEPELMCFLRTVCPELQKRKNTRKVVEILLKMQVTSLKKFKCLPKQRIDALFEALRLSAKKQKKMLGCDKMQDKASHTTGAHEAFRRMRRRTSTARVEETRHESRTLPVDLPCRTRDAETWRACLGRQPFKKPFLSEGAW